MLLLHLPDDHTAATVADAMSAAIRPLPEQLRRSLTCDQGSEMALHTKITEETRLPIYFCDRHSPCQRGTQREHQLAAAPVLPQEHRLVVLRPPCSTIAAELNARPRKRLSFKPPQALQHYYPSHLNVETA